MLLWEIHSFFFLTLCFFKKTGQFDATMTFLTDSETFTFRNVFEMNSVFFMLLLYQMNWWPTFPTWCRVLFKSSCNVEEIKREATEFFFSAQWITCDLWHKTYWMRDESYLKTFRSYNTMACGYKYMAISIIF